VIIPVLGDTRALHTLLERLRNMPAPPTEILVIDGAGDQSLRDFCRHSAIGYLGTRAGRGHQLHSGALAARAEILWFLHADAMPAPAGGIRIRQQIAGGCLGGYFRFRFSGRRTVARSVLAALINLRARIGVPYGDQGIFVTRAAYLAAGGFPDVPLFEEVPLVRALRRAGDFAALPIDIGVSPRRWERDGWIRRTVENRLLALGYMLGIPPARLARRYRLLAPAVTPTADRTEN
jgi:rSAM/selenodomain-associated transferase 2